MKMPEAFSERNAQRSSQLLARQVLKSTSCYQNAISMQHAILHLTLQGARVLGFLRISRHYFFGSHSLSYAWHLCLSIHWHLVCLVGSFRYNGLATLALAGPSGPRAGPSGPLRALRARCGPFGPANAVKRGGGGYEVTRRPERRYKL